MIRTNDAAGRWTAAVLAVLCLLTLLTGCALPGREKEEIAPYTQEQVSRYVRERYGEDVHFMSEEQMSSADGSIVSVYRYKTADDITFAVLAGVQARYVDGLPTEARSRWLSDNYFDRVMAARQEEITAAIAGSGLRGELTQTGQEGRGAGTVCQLRIYLESDDQFNDCVMLLTEINSILGYRAAETDGSVGRAVPEGKSAHIYLQPANRLPDDDPQYSWDGGAYRVFYEISAIPFTLDGEDLNPGEVRETLQHDYVDRARALGRDIYDPGDDLFYKYPASVVTVKSIGDVDVSDSGVFTFVYDRDTDSYWMCCLDPCQDFKDRPYDYACEGTFARMVEDLGGLYFPGKWKASWSIDGSEWSAELVTGESAGVSCAYRRLDLLCDGEVQLLSQVPEGLVRGGSGQYGSNGTVSGRAYSPEDLEKLLHVKTDIDRQNGTAVIYKPVEAEEQEDSAEGQE